MIHMRLNPCWNPVDLILDYVMVIPPLLRPSTNVVYEHDKVTDLYNRILSTIAKEDTSLSRQLLVFNCYHQLLGRGNEDKQKLFKSFISGKTGLVRDAMLGVRNNRAARVIITTNSYIPVSHVGIPRIFKRNLTVFEYLNVLTAKKIAILIANNMVVDPGTMDIKKILGVRTIKDASSIDIRSLTHKLIDACSSGYNRKLIYVERELMDDDWVYINRQPTLQHTSIIAFKAKLVDVHTMELNLAATKTFNADFDGDAMSVYVASDIESQVECMMLLASDKNIYSSSDQQLLIQPIQDCISALYTMTKFDKECSMATLLRVVDVCLMGEYKYSKWSTREFLLRHQRVRGSSTITATTLISMLLPGTMNTNSIAPICIVDGILTSRDAMKKHHVHLLIEFFHTTLGDSHTIWFISMLQLVTDIWLREYPLSVSYSDCNVIPDDVITRVESYYYDNFDKIEDYEQRKIQHPELSQYFEMQILTIIRGQIGARIRQSIKDYLTTHCPSNPFNIMVDSGARGNFTAVSNMMAYLGQQEVNGRQLPLYDVNNDDVTHPVNRGFVLEAYNRGLSKKGAYYQAASGRQGLVNTGSGISDPGVMFRLLWSFLADVQLDYEGRITDYSGTILATL
jgi:DNA-directed RNA polymerase beta' subunit